MNWFYESDGKPQGPIAESALRTLLAEGKISDQTLVWTKGMTDWQPAQAAFNSLLALQQTATPLKAESIEVHPANPISEPTPAWEHSQNGAWPNVFIETVIQVLSHPFKTFENLTPTSGWARPLAFYMICAVTATLLSAVNLKLAPPEELSSIFSKWFAHLSTQATQPPPETSVVPSILAGTLLSILLAPIQMAVSACILHFFLWITGAARKPLDLTFRVLCYATGSASLFLVLPAISAIVASFTGDKMLIHSATLLSQIGVGVFSIAFVHIAISRAHGISLLRVAWAFIGAPLLFTGFIVFTLVLLGGLAVR